MSKLKEELINYCRSNNRICPQPQKWNKLYAMLPNKKQIGNGWEPSLPLILTAWYDTPAISKMIRLSEHLDWADKNNSLEEISKFLYSLSEEDWFHIGD